MKYFSGSVGNLAWARRIFRSLAAILVCFFIGSAIAIGSASAETRKLKLYFLHTKEKAEITYKVNGKYIDSGLRKVNRFLRDWRRDESTKMDPQLLDLIWEVYQKSGSRDYIHIVSAYRSPATNNMLRKRSSGVAKNSQHTLGRAMDFFIPDVKLSKVREVGLKMGIGGVGYYPTSGSPFVHMDTGRVRHWPRMSRKELARVFPNGKTLHVPSDGKPLPGYDRAVASYKAKRSSPDKIVIASAEEAKKPGFFERWSQRLREDQEDDEEANSIGPAFADKDVGIPGIEKRIPVPSREPDSSATQLALVSPEPALTEPASLEINEKTPFELPQVGPFATMRPSANDEIDANDALIANLEEAIGQRVEPKQDTQLAALSPGEIERLRRTAISTNSQAPAAPRPQAEIPRQIKPVPLARPATFAAIVETATAAPLPLENEPVVQATALVDPQPATRQRPAEAAIASVLPQSRPYDGPSKRTLELALAASDEDISASQAIRELIEADIANDEPSPDNTLTATIPVETSDGLRFAKVPVPIRSPAKMVSLTPTTGAIRRNTAQKKPPLRSHYLGEWALASSTSLGSIEKISAPRYGHNALPQIEATQVAAFSRSQPRFEPQALRPRTQLQ